MMNSCEDSFDFPPCGGSGGGGGGDGGDSSSRSDTDSQTSEASPEHDLCEPSLDILLQISKRLSTIYLQPSSVIFHGSYSIPLVNIAESHDKVRRIYLMLPFGLADLPCIRDWPYVVSTQNWGG